MISKLFKTCDCRQEINLITNELHVHKQLQDSNHLTLKNSVGGTVILPKFYQTNSGRNVCDV